MPDHLLKCFVEQALPDARRIAKTKWKKCEVVSHHNFKTYLILHAECAYMGQHAYEYIKSGTYCWAELLVFCATHKQTITKDCAISIIQKIYTLLLYN